jgi:type II secretory pathway pseudopilin PulG
MRRKVTSLRGAKRRSNLDRIVTKTQVTTQPRLLHLRFAMTRGSSLLEVILAVALFLILSTGGLALVVNAYNSNRLGAEFTVATQFASEGIEAVKAIKNQAYANLLNSAGTGVDRHASGYWIFGGANDTLTHNSGDNFIRTIKVESVNRNGTPPAGDIVSSGGTLDADTKKITSTVTWFFSGTRQETLSLITYLSDWRKAIGAAVGDALAIYGDTGNLAQSRFRTYDNTANTFSTEAAAGSGFTDTLVGKNFFVQTSPTKVEAVVGYVNNSGVLRVLCFDGTNWSSEWTVTVGGTGTNDGRFGVAFEKTSGDAMVVYSTNAGTNEMAYRTKAGSTGCGTANWAAAVNIEAVRTTGVVHWIRMENSPVAGSNNIALAWADANSDLSAMIWTGAGWTITEPAAALETNLERVSASQDVLSFDLAYESTSGELMVVWGLSQATTCTAGTTIATTNCIRFATYTTSWSSVAVIPTVADPATNVDITGNPNSNEIALAALDNSQGDLSTAYWSGSAWTGRANVDTAAHCVTAGDKIVATGWLISGATTRSIYVYHDATSTTCTTATTNIGFYSANGSAAPAAGTDFNPTPAFAAPQRWFRIDMDPVDKDRLMFTLSDNGSDFFAKRLVMTATPAFTWTNSDGSAALENSLGQATSRSFGFAYWRNP